MGPHRSRKNLPPSPLHTTRIDPSALYLSSLPSYFPAIAIGIEILTIGEERLGERIWIGGSVHGVEVTRHLRFFALDAPEVRPALFTALRALDGSRSVAELTHSLSIPLADFLRLLLFLESEGLIHFYSQRRTTARTPTTLTRREIERTHLPRGTSFRKRTEQSIAIISDQSNSISPIAISLAALLYGSGFDRITFIKPEHSLREGGIESEQISDRDLGLSIFNGRDIGMRKSERLQELAHRSAILPREESHLTSQQFLSEDFEAKLTISIGYPRPDHHQRWLSEDRPFLIVPGYSQGQVRIGPIVLPGRTPCLRCFELNQIENDFWREQSRQLQLLQPSTDPPAIASHLIASLTALYATIWLDADDDGRMNHLLLGHQYIQTLTQRESKISEETSPVQIQRWQNHPECGCLWLPPAKSTARNGARNGSRTSAPTHDRA
jgi:hypothetical protein